MADATVAFDNLSHRQAFILDRCAPLVPSPLFYIRPGDNLPNALQQRCLDFSRQQQPTRLDTRLDIRGGANIEPNVEGTLSHDSPFSRFPCWQQQHQQQAQLDTRLDIRGGPNVEPDVEATVASTYRLSRTGSSVPSSSALGFFEQTNCSRRWIATRLHGLESYDCWWLLGDQLYRLLGH